MSLFVNRYRNCLCLLGLFLLFLLFFTLLVSKIHSGTLWYHDELLTANRAREILVRHNPWMISLNYEADFHKPPLQYWLTALLLSFFPTHEELAVRLVSTFYGAACIVGTGWLALCLFSENCNRIRLAFWSALTLMVCGYFIRSARMGLLDCGVALYLILAIAGCVLAQGNPKWWWFVGLQAVLGSWQKMPVVFAAWIFIIGVRLASVFYHKLKKEHLDEKGVKSLKSYHLIAAFGVAVALSLGWLFLQWWQFGFSPLHGMIHSQTNDLVARHHPAGTGFRPDFYWIWLVKGWGVIGVLIPLFLVSIIWNYLVVSLNKNRTDVRTLQQANSLNPINTNIFEIACIAFLYLLGFALLPYRSEHYLVAISPLLAVIAVYSINTIIQSRRFCTSLLHPQLLFAFLLLTALPVACFHYFGPSYAQPKLLEASRALGSKLNANEQIIIDPNQQSDFDIKNFALFYANAQDAALVADYIPWFQGIFKDPSSSKPIYRGLSRVDKFETFTQTLPKQVRILYSNSEWICWQLSLEK